MTSVNFLMSSAQQLSDANNALADQGYQGGVDLTVRGEGPWLSVPDRRSAQTTTDIVMIVSGVDAEAVQI